MRSGGPDEELPGDIDDDGLDDCADEPECLICGGEGYVPGYEIADQYDYGWIDEDRSYRCSSCGGSGLARDMTWR